MNLGDLRERLFISVPEAAVEVFKLDERTVRRAIADGQIPGVKVGNKTLIPVPKLLELLGAEQVSGVGQCDEVEGPQIVPRLLPGGGNAA